jgi:hypothetical protein
MYINFDTREWSLQQESGDDFHQTCFMKTIAGHGFDEKMNLMDSSWFGA